MGYQAEIAAEIERNHEHLDAAERFELIHLSGETSLQGNIAAQMLAGASGGGGLMMAYTTKGGEPAKSGGLTYRYMKLSPEKSDDHGYYVAPRFQLTDSKGDPIKGVEYANREILLSNEVSGNLQLRTSQAQNPVPLSSQGILTDRVGFLKKPGSNVTGTSVAIFKNELYHYGIRVGNVSTVFRQDIGISHGQIVGLNESIVTP